MSLYAIAFNELNRRMDLWDDTKYDECSDDTNNIIFWALSYCHMGYHHRNGWLDCSIMSINCCSYWFEINHRWGFIVATVNSVCLTLTSNPQCVYLPLVPIAEASYLERTSDFVVIALSFTSLGFTGKSNLIQIYSQWKRFSESQKCPLHSHCRAPSIEQNELRDEML